MSDLLDAGVTGVLLVSSLLKQHQNHCPVWQPREPGKLQFPLIGPRVSTDTEVLNGVWIAFVFSGSRNLTQESDLNTNGLKEK